MAKSAVTDATTMQPKGQTFHDDVRDNREPFTTTGEVVREFKPLSDSEAAASVERSPLLMRRVADRRGRS